MIEESTFSNKEICGEVFKNYNIDVQSIELITNGSANIYKLYSNDNKYILKEFQSKYGEDDVLREINAIQYLKEKSDIPVPTYVKCNSNNLYFKHKGRVVIMQNFIEGKTCKKNSGNFEKLIDSANYLAKIIKNFEGYEVKNSINVTDWYCEGEIVKATKKYNWILEKLGNTDIDLKIRDDILFKKRLLIELKQKLESSNIQNVTHKVSHGDYSCLQFIYNDKYEVKAILDFIKVKKLPIVWEIVRSYSYIDKEAENGQINIENLVQYTKEIIKTIQLNEDDLRYLPYVYLIQLARSTYGYEEYFKNKKNKEELLNFAFYRTNICRNFMENANKISNRLLKL